MLLSGSLPSVQNFIQNFALFFRQTGKRIRQVDKNRSKIKAAGLLETT